MITVGRDRHKRYITACALDDAGTVLAEHRRREPSLDALCRWLGALTQPVQVVMEATLYWHWREPAQSNVRRALRLWRERPPTSTLYTMAKVTIQRCVY